MIPQELIDQAVTFIVTWLQAQILGAFLDWLGIGFLAGLL